MSGRMQLLSAVALATAAFGLMPGNDARAQSGEPLRVGIIASDAGPVSFLGDPFVESVRLRVEQVNAAGGISGRPVQLFAHDDESSPDKALTFADKLITEEKVTVILGPSLASTTRAILPTVEAARIPVIYDTPINEPRPGSFQFSPLPSEETSYRVALQELQRRGVKRLADRDVTPQMTKLRNASPDAVFTARPGAAVATVSRSYVRLGMKQPLVFSTDAVSIDDPELLEGITPETLIFPTYKVLLGPDALPESDDSHKPLSEHFNAYQAKYGRRPDSTGGSGYDAASLAFAALGRVDANDPVRVRVRDALQQLRAQGMALLVVEQNARVILKLCERAYVLERGAVVRHGTGAEVMNDPSIAEACLGAATA